MTYNLSKSTLVVIVTFNPEIGLMRKNISALCGQFENILIVDNHSSNILEIEELAKRINSAIRIEKLPDNMGIAYAQNVGLEDAVAMKLLWFLTMDQDSVVPENLSLEYQRILENYKGVGLVTWNQIKEVSDREIIENCRWIVSSGTLFSVLVLKRVGGFDNKLFIDHVDTDINLKIINSGISTITTDKVKLYHELGDETMQKTIRGDTYHKHSPIRVYYFIRNSIILFKRYFFKQPVWMLQALIFCFREGIYLLYFQPGKIKNTPLLFRAWFDGIFNKLGKYQGKSL